MGLGGGDAADRTVLLDPDRDALDQALDALGDLGRQAVRPLHRGDLRPELQLEELDLNAPPEARDCIARERPVLEHHHLGSRVRPRDPHRSAAAHHGLDHPRPGQLARRGDHLHRHRPARGERGPPAHHPHHRDRRSSYQQVGQRDPALGGAHGPRAVGGRRTRDGDLDTHGGAHHQPFDVHHRLALARRELDDGRRDFPILERVVRTTGRRARDRPGLSSEETSHRERPERETHVTPRLRTGDALTQRPARNSSACSQSALGSLLSPRDRGPAGPRGRPAARRSARTEAPPRSRAPARCSACPRGARGPSGRGCRA